MVQMFLWKLMFRHGTLSNPTASNSKKKRKPTTIRTVVVAS